jgi:hypothetical protein
MFLPPHVSLYGDSRRVGQGSLSARVDGGNVRSLAVQLEGRTSRHSASYAQGQLPTPHLVMKLRNRIYNRLPR